MAGELILVVEDNDKNRKLVRDVLAAKGYRLLETETGEDGVRVAREQHPALILMDIQLPGIDGIEALRQIRADGRAAGIPVVALTRRFIELHGGNIWLESEVGVGSTFTFALPVRR